VPPLDFGCQCVSIRAPRAGGDGKQRGDAAGRRVRFNPRPPCGGRYDGSAPAAGWIKVSIRAPRAGGDGGPSLRPAQRRCFNPRPPCGGRSAADTKLSPAAMFQSAPPVRGAIPQIPPPAGRPVVSIRAPRAGGDHHRARQLQFRERFQSAPPVRGAMLKLVNDITIDIGFNPRPPCGGRWTGTYKGVFAVQFQSAPPVRGAMSTMYAPPRCC